MYKLKTWVDKKKHETVIEKKRQKASARSKAYGGAGKLRIFITTSLFTFKNFADLRDFFSRKV